MAASPYIVDITRENFQEVVEASHRVPVLIDFWASWCQPCQMLMPVLAKLANEYQGRFLLAKLNTEEQQDLAAQFGIRSIPTVKLFSQGRPVDEFMGALPESEVRRFLDPYLPRESDNQVEQALDLLASGQAEAARALLQQTIDEDPDNHRATVALARTLAALGQAKDAEQVLDALPLDEGDKPEVAALRSQLYFAGLLADAPPAETLSARLEADPKDSEARFFTAVHQVLADDYAGAMEQLLGLMRDDRQYGDDAARKTLVKIFELLGDDPLVGRYRGRMASLLY
jgi:putative thioredoxin